jgi:adenylate cyclase class 2
MQIEFEATFLNVNKDEIRARLKSVGAVLIYPEYIMKRLVFEPPIQIPGGWLRVRQEAEKVTMSLKIVDGDKIENQKEIELTINSVEDGVSFLENIGAKNKSYQETLRELWKLDGCEICIDTWPGLNPYVEVESDNEEKVKLAANKLGFEYSTAYFGSVDGVYLSELGIPKAVIDSEPVITFENPPQHYEK